MDVRGKSKTCKTVVKMRWIRRYRVVLRGWTGAVPVNIKPRNGCEMDGDIAVKPFLPPICNEALDDCTVDLFYSPTTGDRMETVQPDDWERQHVSTNRAKEIH